MVRFCSDSIEELMVFWYSGKILVFEGIDYFYKVVESGDLME